MAKKFFWFGILVFGLSIVVFGQDTLINGTWVDENGFMRVFNNGRYRYITITGTAGSTEGSYTISGNNITIITARYGSETFAFSINNNTLTLNNEFGKIIFTKKGSSRIIEKNLVGRWRLSTHSTIISESDVTDRYEFFDDGTGIMSKGNKNVSFTWRLRDGNRLQMNAGRIMGTQTPDIDIFDNGTTLIFYEGSAGIISYIKN
ncbi:hypothetical protein K7I13_07100 [Brucepastera parasyntrophica]|uniref:hypothetical protein n=1 Tax=Brucepastera parasyntrophica TaxID=2880008 RepID=UPI002109D593|nr:hypothetical protein [Brucepastera parasyntrophica]ULQ61012.1 hypothetical protein K7I13_07100 [Brucepastera parasyntrophica]